MPFVVFENGFQYMPCAPSEWMGNDDALTLAGQHSERRLPVTIYLDRIRYVR